MNLGEANEKRRRFLIEERNRKAHHSYLFHFYGSTDDYNPYYAYYPWFDPEGESEDVPERDDDFFEVELYQSSAEKSQPYHRMFYRRLLKDYFAKPFGDHINLSNKWVMLPKSKYNDFSGVISRFGLEEYSDFLLECVCLAQKKLMDDVRYWESIESQAIKKTALGQSKLLSSAIKQHKESVGVGKIGKKRPRVLDSITFASADKPFRITNPFLISTIMDSIEKGLLEWSGTSYEQGAKNWADAFKEYPAKNEFKFELALSFHNFLVSLEIFDLSKGATPNSLVSCIVQLLEFSLIEISRSDESERVKINIVRAWIKRTRPIA